MDFIEWTKLPHLDAATVQRLCHNVALVLSFRLHSRIPLYLRLPSIRVLPKVGIAVRVCIFLVTRLFLVFRSSLFLVICSW